MFKEKRSGGGIVPVIIAAAILGIGALGSAQGQQVAREDTLIATGQTSAGSPTFAQYNDFNPFRPGLDLRSSITHVLEALYYYNALDDKMIPWLATGYEYNDKYDSVTIQLRKGVTWSDGEAFNADDVIYTIDMLRKNGKGKKDMAEGAALARDVKDLVRIDDHTVRVDLNSTNPRWFFTHLTERFTEGMHIVPEHVYSTVDPNELGTFTALGKPGWPVGTGAFRIAEMTPERIILDRRDDWWGAKLGFHKLPEMKRVIFVPFTTHEQAAQLLASGRVDTILEATVPVMKQLLAKDNITTFSGKQPPYGNIDWWPTALFFQFLDEQWQDIRIRKAVSLYINQEQAVDYAYEGAAETTYLPYPRYKVLEPHFADMKEVAEKNRILGFDVAAADALMKEAGCVKDAQGFWTKGGKRLGGDLYHTNSLNQIAPVVAEQLRRAGFEVAPTARPGYRNTVFHGGATWWMWGNGASVNDPFHTLRLYHKRWATPRGQEALWPTRWQNDKYSAIVDEIEASSPTDPKVRGLVKDALTILLEEQVIVPISQFYHRIPFNTTYWTNFPTKEDPYITPTFWHETGYLMLLGMEKTKR
jgi:peptide/nickel transport system substrate-binding protein